MDCDEPEGEESLAAATTQARSAAGAGLAAFGLRHRVGRRRLQRWCRLPCILSLGRHPCQM